MVTELLNIGWSIESLYYLLGVLNSGYKEQPMMLMKFCEALLMIQLYRLSENTQDFAGNSVLQIFGQNASEWMTKLQRIAYDLPTSNQSGEKDLNNLLLEIEKHNNDHTLVLNEFIKNGQLREKFESVLKSYGEHSSFLQIKKPINSW